MNTQGKKQPYKVPPGKRVLNTHISLEEHTFLKAAAAKNSMTITMYLRNMIRREMARIALKVVTP